MIGLWRHMWFRMSAAVVAAVATVAIGEAANPFRRETSIEKLAKQVDKLERELQYTGRVVVKSPDIWGQARLTAHREEFEQQMKAQLDQFTPTINAEIYVRDEAFLAQALTLSGAAQGITGRPLPGGQNSATITNEEGQNETTLKDADVKFTEINVEQLNSLVTDKPTFSALQLPATSSFAAAGAFQLEPEILLDQRKRFLDHLHQIRRMNEGDDTADSPGYSLNLVRVPVSIIPGDHTRENYGAEATFIAEAHVTDELLPATFRELVINDLVDQLSLPVVKLADHMWEKLQTLEQKTQELAVAEHKAKSATDFSKTDLATTTTIGELDLDVPATALTIQRYGLTKADFLKSQPDDRTRNLKLSDRSRELVTEFSNRKKKIQEQIDTLKSEIGTQANELKIFNVIPTPRDRRSRYPVASTQSQNVFGTAEFREIVRAVFGARDRLQCRDRLTLTDVQSFLRNELEYAYDYLSSGKLCTIDSVHGFVEIEGLWNTPDFPTANDVRQPATIHTKRECFFRSLAPHATEGAANSQHTSEADNATEALAWAILVESALLNQQLNDDLKQVSQDPNCGCVYGGPYVFYGPDPQPEAKQAFVQYVKCRWPIRVFALDPVTQQQNVADTFSLRREGQLAIALAFQKGFVNTQSLTRYMRRIEQDMRTISLNNTHVAFGAGDDTFGWRFYPRVQTPDVESNVKTIGRDLIWGGPNRDARLKRWRIEPGMRECVALVVMPSFIKHVRFDVRTSWFPLVPNQAVSELTKKGENGVTLKTTVEWSREVQAVENSMMACVQDEHLYRPGEVERIVKRAQQISRQLPLNTMYTQVPYENTLGGFEMFASGVTDLAPELVGFYGAPGVDPERETTLFLVGDNFSVHDTRVIAGNAQVQTKMLSREVIQVDIPQHVRVDRRLCAPRQTLSEGSSNGVCCAAGCNDFYVEVRLATPYGVSSPLYIPVVADNGVKVVNLCGATPTPISPGPGQPIPETKKPETKTPTVKWNRASYPIQYRLTFKDASNHRLSGVDLTKTEILSVRPHELGFTSTDPALPTPDKDKPKAKVRIWIDKIGDSDMVPNQFLVKDAEVDLKDGSCKLSDEAFAKFHTDLRDIVLRHSVLTKQGLQDKVNVSLNGAILLDGKTYQVNTYLVVPITLAPPVLPQ